MSLRADYSGARLRRLPIPREITETPILIVCAAVVGIFIWLGADEAGYPLTVWYPAALLILALLGAWELYVDLGGVDSLILPAPHAVAAAMYDDRGLLWSNFLVTAATRIPSSTSSWRRWGRSPWPP